MKKLASLIAFCSSAFPRVIGLLQDSVLIFPIFFIFTAGFYLSLLICVLSHAVTLYICMSPQPKSSDFPVFIYIRYIEYALTNILLIKIMTSIPLSTIGNLKNHGLHAVNCTILSTTMALSAISVPKNPKSITYTEINVFFISSFPHSYPNYIAL